MDIHYRDPDGSNSTPVSAATPLPTTSGGNVAGAATDSGNPVKVGAVYNSAPPTYTNGQRTDAQADTRGNLKVTLLEPDSANPISGAAIGADGVSASTRALAVRAHGYRFNGTTWDRDRKANATSRIASAAATTNATSAKASAGDLGVISGYNAAASVRYLKFYNKASAPTVGTDTPVITLALPAASAFNINMGGHYFSTGIAYALTTGAADADTGALTLADVVGLTITYA